MKNLFITATLFFALVILTLAPTIALAGHTTDQGSVFVQPRSDQRIKAGLGGPQDVITLIEAIANWIFTALIAIAVIFILLAAWEYMSNGSEGVEKAHKMLLYAAVGIAIAVLSRGIVFAVRKLVDSNTMQAPTTQSYIYDHTV